MRYLATKKDNEYEVTHINEMTTIEGKKVEVIMGTTIANKEKLESTIKDLKSEKKERIAQMESDIQELENILKAINNSK